MKIRDLPDIVHIQSTNRCNLKCRMCPRGFYGLKEEDLGFSVYKDIVDKIPLSVKAVDLTGWGEPLLHPKIFEMINYASRKGFITYLTTNAALLSRESQGNLIKSGLSALTISLERLKFSRTHTEAGHPYSKRIIRNIQDFARLRRPGNKPLVSICVTLHRGRERQVLEIINFARRLHLDLVHLARLNTAFAKGLKRTTFKEDLSLWKECLKNKFSQPMVLLTEFQYLGLSRDYPNGSCPKIHNYTYVNIRGKVAPCCNLPNYEVGDIMRDGLIKIWKGRKYKYFRNNQPKICRKFCNLFIYP